MVLGGGSEILDVGRSRRFVTAPIFKALTLRDGGCAFPGCDVPASRCDTHHIRPWWDGGVTALANLVLLCPTHHGHLEPDRTGLRDQWRVTLPDTGHVGGGKPVFTPPHHDQEPHTPADPPLWELAATQARTKH
jgi:hypothetical protein